LALKNADIIIVDQPDPLKGDTPYIDQQALCGQPATDDTISYTTEYIRTSNQIDNRDKFGIPGMVVLTVK